MPVGRWSTSSTPPISMMRWPSTGSRPVVSVSRTISRNRFVLWAARAQGGHDLLHLREGMVQPLVGLNHEMRLCTLFCIRHLTGQDVVELVLGHARTTKHTRALNVCRSGHHHHRVHARVAPCFEQQWDIHYHHLCAFGRGIGKELPLLVGN